MEAPPKSDVFERVSPSGVRPALRPGRKGDR
jgi:hypothetical protein